MVMQVPLFGLNGHKVKSTPWTAYVVNPRITCTFEPHQSNQKERDHTWKTCPDTWRKKQKKTQKRWSPEQRHVVSTQDRQVKSWKKASCFTLLKRITRLKKVKPRTAARCSTHRPTRWNRKKANCFTLLRRITKLKTVNSEIRSTVHSPT